MEEKVSNPNITPNPSAVQQQVAAQENARVLDEKIGPEQNARVAVGQVGIEHRTAYGTAQTESLRDSGLWRVILPLFVGLLCLALLAVPLMILIPLLANSIDPNSFTHLLLWLWITMIVIEIAVAAVLIRGLVKIFMTQAGNYRS